MVKKIPDAHFRVRFAELILHLVFILLPRLGGATRSSIMTVISDHLGEKLKQKSKNLPDELESDRQCAKTRCCFSAHSQNDIPSGPPFDVGKE